MEKLGIENMGKIVAQRQHPTISNFKKKGRIFVWVQRHPKFSVQHPETYLVYQKT